MLTSTEFIVTGGNDLTAIPVPDNRFPDYYFKSELVELMGEAYKNMHELILKAKSHPKK